MPPSSGSSHRKHSKRQEWRYVSILSLCIIYLLGVFSGSFFCGMTSTLRPEESLMDHASPAILFANRQQNPLLVSTSTFKTPPSTQQMRRSPFDTTKLMEEKNEKDQDSSSTNKKLFQPHELKLPTPIIIMGLMKAGTTSVYGYFQCGLDPTTSRLSHYDCKPTRKDPEKIGMACGKRMRRNLTKNHKPAFDTMDNFTLYAELDAQELNGGMTLPQWDYLEPIYKQFPSASWILNVREPRKWLNSVDRWKDLRERFVNNPFLPDLPVGVGKEDSEMIRFYERQAQRIRDFADAHPSLSLVEVPIDSPNAGSIMEEAFGIPKTCWRNRNVNNGTAIWTDK